MVARQADCGKVLRGRREFFKDVRCMGYPPLPPSDVFLPCKLLTGSCLDAKYPRDDDEKKGGKVFHSGGLRVKYPPRPDAFFIGQVVDTMVVRWLGIPGRWAGFSVNYSIESV